MPLRRGRGRATISSNIREMLASPTFGRGKPARVRRRMAVAAALRKSRER